MQLRFEVLFVFLLACGSSSGGDAGADGTAPDGSSGDAAADATCPSVDASFTCDVSSLPTNALTCTDWTGSGQSCPAAFGWSTGVGGSGCEYTWTKSGPPDLCALPAKNGMGAFTWLQPACDGGCN